MQPPPVSGRRDPKLHHSPLGYGRYVSKLIVIMIDGVSANYFAQRRVNLPNLDALAARGLVVERVAADVPGTSLPGRTSMITGVPASEHGVFGNTIWDGRQFRYANPDDVRMPTLPRAAIEHGLRAAVVGFGMVRPEDASIFKGPWWANEMLQRARDESPIPADESWLRTSGPLDPTGEWARLARAGFETDVPDAYAGDIVHNLLSGAAGDRTMMRWTTALATSEDPPDLMITEILLTDSIQHVAGQDHPFSDWAVGFADDLVGTLVSGLERANVLSETTIMITSDHGHGTVDRALYTDRLLPGRQVSSEGSVLLARIDDEADALALAQMLKPHGVARLSSSHLPDDRRGDLALFCAPDGCDFQPRPSTEGVDPAALSGPPKHLSSHGFRPGHPDDERFCVLVGPGIEPGRRQRAAAEDIAATAAGVIGVAGFGSGESFV